jgi:hypothetical protein
VPAAGEIVAYDRPSALARTHDLPTQHRKLVTQNRDLDITSIR